MLAVPPAEKKPVKEQCPCDGPFGEAVGPNVQESTRVVDIAGVLAANVFSHGSGGVWNVSVRAGSANVPGVYPLKDSFLVCGFPVPDYLAPVVCYFPILL